MANQDKVRKKQVNLVMILFKLPLGTEILDEEQKVILGEINTTADKVLIIPGGNGGLGNHNFKSSTNRAPRKFTSKKKVVKKLFL